MLKKFESNSAINRNFYNWVTGKTASVAEKGFYLWLTASTGSAFGYGFANFISSVENVVKDEEKHGFEQNCWYVFNETSRAFTFGFLVPTVLSVEVIMNGYRKLKEKLSSDE